MGTRSDVFLAVKSAFANEFNEKFGPVLREDYGAEVLVDEAGTAYFMEDVKWYYDSYDDLISIYRWLRTETSDEDYVIVTACSEYPADDNGDVGSWFENPWQAYREVSATIRFDGRRHDTA